MNAGPLGRIDSDPIETLGVSSLEVGVASRVGPHRQPIEGAKFAPPIRLPAIERCGHQPTLTVMVFDESGSVQSRNDPWCPIAGRRAETAAVLTALGTCRHGCDLVAFVYFDTGMHDVEATPLTRAGAAAVDRALTGPAPSTSSRLTAALAKTRATIESFPAHDAAVVVFSDFELFDPDPDGVLRELAGMAGRVHAVVLHSPVPAVLEDDARVTVTHIRGNDRIPGAVAHALVPTLARKRRVGAEAARARRWGRRLERAGGQ